MLRINCLKLDRIKLFILNLSSPHNYKFPEQPTITLHICVHVCTTPVRIAHMCAYNCTTVIHSTALNSSDSLVSYRPDNHHSSDDVYRRGGGAVEYLPKFSCWSSLDRWRSNTLQHTVLLLLCLYKTKHKFYRSHIQRTLKTNHSSVVIPSPQQIMIKKQPKKLQNIQ